jgi:hypothetical protein
MMYINTVILFTWFSRQQLRGSEYLVVGYVYLLNHNHIRFIFLWITLLHFYPIKLSGKYIEQPRIINAISTMTPMTKIVERLQQQMAVHSHQASR